MRRIGVILQGAATSLAAFWVHEQSEIGEFPLVLTQHATPLIVADDDFKVARLAAHDLQIASERVSGQLPVTASGVAELTGPVVIIDTLGKNPRINRHTANRKRETRALRGQGKSFISATVANSFRTYRRRWSSSGPLGLGGQTSLPQKSHACDHRRHQPLRSAVGPVSRNSPQ